MAQLPPKAVFGSTLPGQAVSVFVLIENSLAMLDHWADLQHHILPGILGAVRIANPGIDVKVFCMTTGKTEGTRGPEQVPEKSQRQFNDFPDIDIVNIPRNRMSATFIRQSIDMFLGGLTSAPHVPVTRHLFLVAMSSPVDDISSPQSPTLSINTGAGSSSTAGSKGTTESTDAIWDAICQKLQENDIYLHVIANPVVRLTRIFDVFRKTMRAQSRQEVIPWQPVDNTHCICHLSGSNRYRREKREYPIEDWPEMNLPVSAPPSPRPGSPTDGSEDEHTYMSPMELINDNLSRAAAASAAAAASHNGPSSPSSSVGAGMSLVSRMQAIHGLANRRRPGERTRSRRSAFFRDAAPAAGPPSPSPRRERLRSLGSMSSMAVGVGSGASSSSSLFTGAGSPYPNPLANTGMEHHVEVGRMGRSRHHSLSSTSALDLQGLANSGVTFSAFHQLNSGLGGSGNVPYPIDTSGLVGGGQGILPPSSPASDTSGSASALSNSFTSIPPHHSQAHQQQQQHSSTPTATQIGQQTQHASLYPPSSNPYSLNQTLSPLQAVPTFPGPFSHNHTIHHDAHSGGYHPHPHPHPTSTFHTPLHSPTHLQSQMQAEGGSGGYALYGPTTAQGYFGPIGPNPGAAPRTAGSEFEFAVPGPRSFPAPPPPPLSNSSTSTSMSMGMDVRADGYAPGPSAGSGGSGVDRRRQEEFSEGEEEEEEVVQASAPPSAQDQRPFVFDAAYEARSARNLRQAVGEMEMELAGQGMSSPPPPSSHSHSNPHSQYHQQLSSSPPFDFGGAGGGGGGGYMIHGASAPPGSAPAPRLEATRSSSSTFSDSSTSASASASLPRNQSSSSDSGFGRGGRGLGLALDDSWKGHSQPNRSQPQQLSSTTAAQSQSSEIPELPETFYEPSRAAYGVKLAERGAGLRRSTYGPT